MKMQINESMKQRINEFEIDLPRPESRSDVDPPDPLRVTSVLDEYKYRFYQLSTLREATGVAQFGVRPCSEKP